MTRYQITITHTSGKNAGLKVSYSKKRLDTIMYMAQLALSEGDKVEIESFEVCENFEERLLNAVKEACNE